MHNLYFNSLKSSNFSERDEVFQFGVLMLSKFWIAMPYMLIFRIKISSALSIGSIFCRILSTGKCTRCHKPESKNLDHVLIIVSPFCQILRHIQMNTLPRKVTCQLSLRSYTYFADFHVYIFMGEVKYNSCLLCIVLLI